MALLGLMITLGVMLVLLVIAAIIVIYFLSWNIPTVILRYQGDKRRPQVAITKARKNIRSGVARLYVRGYRIPLSDFKAENYYPAKKGKHGALLLFEPKPGVLTPLLPKSVIKKLDKNDKEVIDKILAKIGQDASAIDFEFSEDMYKQLILNAVDDVDIEFMLQEIARVDSQYTSGWRDFLMKYGGHLLVAIVAICLLAGFIVWLDKQPEMAAQCIGAARETSENLIKAAAGQLSNGGTPPPG